MRKTKIICTLGPSTDQDGVLEKLVKEGMNVARFNFSHGLHDEQKGRIDSLKEIRTRLGKPVAALLDTKGPEIRIREFENGKITLKAHFKSQGCPAGRGKSGRTGRRFSHSCYWYTITQRAGGTGRGAEKNIDGVLSNR